MNRAIAMHNILIPCKEIALYVTNTYRSPSTLFISGRGEIVSQEETTQGVPMEMALYAITTLHLSHSLLRSIPQVMQVWLADDSDGGCCVVSLYQWYKLLSKQ